AVLGVALGTGPPRLAHRVLRHVDGAPRHAFRRARRRHGPQVPASRERDRAVVRRDRGRLRESLDAQRLRQRRRGEDVEVARQLLHAARGAADAAPSRGAALLRSLEPLPRPDQLLPRAARASRCRARPGAAAGAAAGRSDAESEARIAARTAARRARNWAESDRILDELARGGVVLEDKPGGKTSWRRA